LLVLVEPLGKVVVQTMVLEQMAQPLVMQSI